jgi:hypothetical protein
MTVEEQRQCIELLLASIGYWPSQQAISGMQSPACQERETARLLALIPRLNPGQLLAISLLVANLTWEPGDNEQEEA